MLPTGVIGISHHAWKPLGQEEGIGVGFLEPFVATAGGVGVTVHDIKAPGDIYDLLVPGF